MTNFYVWNKCTPIQQSPLPTGAEKIRTTGAVCTSDDLGEDCSFGNNDGTTTILLGCEQDGLSTVTVIASPVPR